MTTKIIITLPSSYNDCSDIINSLQTKIVSYFGSKFATANENYPVVDVFCDVTENDMDYIAENVSPSIQFTAIVGAKNSNKVKERFIYLD